ncbi:hypothetical protein D3C83_261050 [compost metagenome]
MRDRLGGAHAVASKRGKAIGFGGEVVRLCSVVAFQEEAATLDPHPEAIVDAPAGDGFGGLDLQRFTQR